MQAPRAGRCHGLSQLWIRRNSSFKKIAINRTALTAGTTRWASDTLLKPGADDAIAIRIAIYGTEVFTLSCPAMATPDLKPWPIP
jgi:hypothetical protein